MNNLKNRSALFISPCKTSAVAKNSNPVQKLRTNISLPAITVLGALESAGFQTYFMDLTTENWNNQWMVGEHLLAYGLSHKETVEKIAKLDPQFVLITSMFTFEYMMVDELVKEIKKSLPKVWVILGGIHASAKPEWHFEDSQPDFIVIGEGERTVIELLIELSRPAPQPSIISGIAFRDNQGNIVKTKPRELITELDRFWAIEKVLIQPDGRPRYIEGMTRKSPVYVSEKIGEDIPTFTIFGSRGCPKYCKYCTATRRTGANIRHIGAYQMFSHFLTARHKYNASVFCNQSDTFAIHQNDIDFLMMVREYRISSKDNQFVINNPNAFFLEQFFNKEKNVEINIELIKLLKDAGFNTITIAIETLTQRFNNKINWKRIKPEIVYELCQTIRAMGFKIDIYIMYGFPEQTLEEFNTDLKFAENLLQYVDLITWNSFSLLPGTIYYDNYIEKQGREMEFRQMILKGYGCYYPDESFNLSNVNLKHYKESLAPFGQSWI